MNRSRNLKGGAAFILAALAAGGFTEFSPPDPHEWDNEERHKRDPSRPEDQERIAKAEAKRKRKYGEVK